MKPLFKIGLPRIEPYSYVEDGQFQGLYAPIHYALHYYLYDKFNINLIDLGPRRTDECFANGFCSGSLSSLQSGFVDFVDEFAEGQFPTLPINLTFGPTIKQEECHLINRPNVQVKLRENDFLVSINRFEHYVIVTFVILCLGFIVLVMLTYRIKLQTPRDITLWSLYEIAFGRRSLPLISRLSSVGLAFSWFMFFILLIASCTFQTGLIRSFHTKNIDSVEDILSYSLIPTVFKYRFCRFLIEKSNIPIYKTIRSKLNIIDPENSPPIAIFELMNNSSHVLIADKSFGLRFKAFLCKMNGDKEAMKSPLYTSISPIDRIRFPFVLSSSTEPETAKTATRATYSAFETANIDNVVTKRIDFKCTGLDNYYGKCTRETVYVDKIILTPLTISYFHRILKILAVTSSIGFFVFIIEFMIPPNEEEKPHQTPTTK